jgi:uncharacterized protein (TIGR03083 family)
MLSPETYLEAIRRESLRFRTVLADCDPAARVPACPEWTAADLLSHLGGVQWFWGCVIAERPAPPADDIQTRRAARPAAYDELLALFDEQSAAFQSVLATAPPSDAAWHWLPSGQTVVTSYRRQAHEALIHRLDAEQTAGSVTELDDVLAGDGVDEALDWMYGGQPPEGVSFVPGPGVVSVYAEDTDATWWVQPGSLPSGPHLLLVDEPSSAPAASVRGTAGDLDAWMWHRLPDSAVSLTGDASALEAFRAAVAPALD